MHPIAPVIQLAKERALFRFSALAARMLQDANTTLGQQIPVARSAAEQKAISASRDFLVTSGPTFLARLTSSYAGYVERGMQTMYRDLRQGLRDVSADTLTLMDDNTVTRQIEVERRVLKLRDADQQSLGLLNLMIAQVHGEHDVRERENPFRPYLMARALHDVLYEMMCAPDVSAMLFDHLSAALAAQLPEYFAAIRSVFESNGVHARLLARPSALSRKDRERLAQLNSSPVSGAGFSHSSMPATALPAVGRILTLLQQKPADPGSLVQISQGEQQGALQDVLWKIVNQSAAARPPATPRRSVNDSMPDIARQSLLDRLDALQQQVAAAVPTERTPVDWQCMLEEAQIGELDRLTIDVVATLFDYLARDKLIPYAFRAPLLRLQVPFAKAALLAPEMLQQPTHPARHLLDRMTAVAIGQTTETAWGKVVLSWMDKTASRLLEDGSSDAEAFASALTEFNQAVDRLLGSAGDEVVRTVAVLKEATQQPKKSDVLIAQTANVLREKLAIMAADPRAVDFLVSTWSRVLVQAEAIGAAGKDAYRETIADLLWSVQPLATNERSTLMRLLPSLVQRLRDGLQLIELRDGETQRVMDDLVAMHTDVLRRMQTDSGEVTISLAALHQHFDGLTFDAVPGAAETTALHAPAVSGERLQALLHATGLPVHCSLDSELGVLLDTDRKWLADMQPGKAIEWWNGSAYQPAVLMWVDPQQSLYLFRSLVRGEDVRLPLYSSIALIKALREGSAGMMEYAPVFDRAIESLLQDGGGDVTPSLH